MIGGISFLISIIPCFASIGLYPGIAGVLVGFIGLLIAFKSDGRIGSGMSIGGMSVSTAAIIIAVGWLVIGKKVEKEIERRGKQEVAKAEAKRKAQWEQAAKDVQAADPNTIVRVTAAQFFAAYEQDEEQADRFYKNRVIEITGIVQRVDFSGDVFTVMLRGGPDQNDTVDCEFAADPAIREQLTRLVPGATVTIRGKCLGDVASIEACVLVK